MSISECAGLLQTGDPDRFLATMAAPPKTREVMFPIYAFNLEVARAPWVTKEAMIAEMRLQWWHDIVDAAQTGSFAAHEVAEPLQRLIADHEMDIAALHEVINARRWDIYRDPFANWQAFDDHIEASAGGLAWAAASALGARDELQAPLRDVAFAGGVARWLMAIPALEDQGRLPLPDGRPDAVRDLAQRALDRLRRARGTDFAQATPIARADWDARAVLIRAARDPRRVARGNLKSAPAVFKARLMWRAMRGTW